MDYRDLQFVLVGPSKTGTVWLSQCLREHPDVFVSRETNYLTHFQDMGNGYWTKHFDGKGSKRVLGEYSNWYSSYAFVAEALAQRNPDLKIVFSLRDPVKRAISMYRHDLEWGTLGRHVTLSSAIGQDLFFYRYIDPGRYSVHVERFLVHFPAAQVYLFSSPCDGGNADQRLADLFDFIGVEPTQPVSLHRVLNQTHERPFFMPLHRGAYRNGSRMVRALCRGLDVVNVYLGAKMLRRRIAQHDIETVAKLYRLYRERESLSAIVSRYGLRGEMVLDTWSGLGPVE